MRAINKLFISIIYIAGSYFPVQAQVKAKIPLDHTVYDEWQEIGSKEISNDGGWVAYTIKPQEGNEQLVVYNVLGRTKLNIARSSNPVFTRDNQFLLFRIHPDLQNVKQAIKEKDRKKQSGSNDTLAILNLKNGSLLKKPGLLSFQVPKKGSGWIAFHVRRDPIEGKDTDTLFIYNLKSGEKKFFSGIENYRISDSNNYVVLSLKYPGNHNKGGYIALWYDPEQHTTDTLSKGAGAYSNFVFDGSCNQLAFLTQGDTNNKEQKLFSLYYYQNGENHARRLTQSEINTRPYLQTINGSGKIFFSKNGEKLFFNTVPVPIENTLNNPDRVNVDVWRYNDDNLFTRQQKLLEDSARGHLAMVDLPSGNLIQLEDENIPIVLLSDEGNSDVALGITDKDDRISSQWRTNTLKTAYLISLKDGSSKKIVDTIRGEFHISSSGNFVIWYNGQEKSWFTYNVLTGGMKNITQQVPDPFYDVEYDRPEFPPSYGIAGWTEGDRSVLLYGRYDIWQIDLTGEKKALNITNGFGKEKQIVFRVVNKSSELPLFSPNQFLTLTAFYKTNKQEGFYKTRTGVAGNPELLTAGPYHFSKPIKARNNKSVFIFTRESFVQSPDLYVGSFSKALRISDLNPQQEKYNWGAASLVKWDTYNGKSSEGILYKPENFDSTRQYPLIVFFYEKLSDRLNYYIPPAPTPSRLNISFFVSQGYLVFTPDISYTTGHPGKSAYDYIVSGVRSLLHHSWIDSTRIGIQGQSWGGYQTAYLITQTPLFKAAWAGAPVADMFSAYGGIRWGSGQSRQFQYEHAQSRIGATIWESPDLYFENSPLFFLPQVHTPLMIMANDHDEKVPWYQGIELFTALRRLGKLVWMLNYLGEKHNLVKRENRKDISIKQQEFFDHFLKNAPLPRWMQRADQSIFTNSKL